LSSGRTTVLYIAVWRALGGADSRGVAVPWAVTLTSGTRA